MKNRILYRFLICTLVISAGTLAHSNSIEYTFSQGPPVVPTTSTLAGSAADWTLEPNRDNVDASITAADLSGGYLDFMDNASIGGNLGLMTPENAALREQYSLSGSGDRLWIVFDHKVNIYGHRADMSINNVDQSRAQLIWVTFENSAGNGFGVNYVAGNFNSEGNIYFTAIGDANQNQNQYREEGHLIEEGASPNLNRRTLTLRITETPFSDYVIVDARYDNEPYKRISSFYNGNITAYPAGNGTGDENVLLAVGNFSGSGAIEFEAHRLLLTSEDPAPDAQGGNEAIAIRSIASSVAEPGTSVAVDVQLFNPSTAAQNITVIEELPEGYSASNISDGGVFQNGNVTWNLSAAPGAKTLTYSLDVPSSAELSPTWSGMIGEFSIGGPNSVLLQKAAQRTPSVTAWNPPSTGWHYIYDPDLGSPENIVLDGWAHNNGSDEYTFQPTLTQGDNAGQVWRNPSFIDDEDFGGQALRIYDPGNPIEMSQYMTTDPGSNRKITLNYDLGPTTKAVAAFRVRTREFVDDFGVTIPFGYPDADQYPLLGLNINATSQSWNAWDALAGSGLFFDPNWQDTLNFPYSDVVSGPYVPGSTEFGWDHTVWHEYWITWNVTPGEKSTALYVDGELQPMFSYPLTADHPYYEDTAEFRDAQARGAFFNRSREADADVPAGNAVFRITFRNTGDAGNLEFDYIALAAGTDEPPSEFVRVQNWSIFE